MSDQGYELAADKFATNAYSVSRSKYLEQQIESLEARLQEMRRAKGLLDKYHNTEELDIEELASILARI